MLDQDIQFSAWNPGIETNIPADYQHLETIYQPENVFSTFAQVDEFSRITGLEHRELVRFKPARMALHELIIRVTANILVPEGEQEEDLGIDFRKITLHIFQHYIEPQIAEFENEYERLYQRIIEMVNNELEISLFTKPQTAVNDGWLSRLSLFNRNPRAKTPSESPAERNFRIITNFRDRGLSCQTGEQAAVFRSLYRVLGSMLNTRGHISPNQILLSEIIAGHVCNYHGTRLIGEQVEKLIEEAIASENYPRIVEVDKPILISLKGTSAAGKSSLRPMLQEMIRQLGVEKEGYGIISPDIWRRLLIDYEDLGEAYKYAGRLTSYEVIIIDSKLDHYIRGKAEARHSIPHLLVDRFRFDSFSSEKVSRVLHKTYVRYIDTMYMYFVITPPEETVVRGWERGLARGRYKSVEDFLGHSVEAYAGMPKLLFKYLANPRPRYVFEFLDNSVPKGEFPTRIARGTQKSLEIFDPMGFVNIQRYQHININADNADAVYADKSALPIENNLEFLTHCIAKIEQVNFIDPESGKTYLQSISKQFQLTDRECFRSMIENNDLASVFGLLAPQIYSQEKS